MALLRSFAGVIQQSFCNVSLGHERFVVATGRNAFDETSDGGFQFQPNPRPDQEMLQRLIPTHVLRDADRRRTGVNLVDDEVQQASEAG